MYPPILGTGMKLTNIFPQIKTDNKVQARKAEGAAPVKGIGAGVPVGGDRVELSAGSQDVQKAREILQQTPAVRTDRVEALRQQVERGEYQVDSQQVAGKMLMSLISDNIVGE